MLIFRKKVFIMKHKTKIISAVLLAALALGTLTACGSGSESVSNSDSGSVSNSDSGSASGSSGGTIELTNVSYAPTRELQLTVTGTNYPILSSSAST